MITMYRRTIEYFKVSLSEHNHRIKLSLWSHHFDPKTQCYEQRRTSLLLKIIKLLWQSSDMKRVNENKCSDQVFIKLWRWSSDLKSMVNVMMNIWPTFVFFWRKVTAHRTIVLFVLDELKEDTLQEQTNLCKRQSGCNLSFPKK